MEFGINGCCKEVHREGKHIVHDDDNCQIVKVHDLEYGKLADWQKFKDQVKSVKRNMACWLEDDARRLNLGW